MFVSTIIRKVGEKGLPTSGGGSLPQTQFTVQVEEILKGDVVDEIVVNQLGGIDGNSWKLLVFEGETLFKKGEQALLFTRFDRANNWHDVLAIDEGERRVTAGQERRRLIERFRAAADRGPQGPVEASTLLELPVDSARQSDSSGRPTKCDHAAWKETMPERPDPDCYYPRPRP